MFFDNLKSICDEKGLKVTTIVVECGGSKGSISNWKKGGFPNSDIVMKLAVRLGVSTDLLLFGENRNEVPNHTENESEMLSLFDRFTDREQIKIIGKLEDWLAEKQRRAISEQSQVNTKTAYMAARSSDKHPQKTVTGNFSDVENAPDATDEY